MRLKGTRVVLTGSFAAFDGRDVRAALADRGAIVVEDVAPGVEVVFAGEGAGSEVDAARELGVRVKGADDLQAALSAEEPPDDEIDTSFDVGSFDLEPPAYLMEDAPPPEDAPVASAAPTASSGATNREFDRGATVKIVGGKQGVGEVGEIFWWGESKYGDGMRAGVKSPDGETYWVDEADLGWPDEEIPAEVVEAAKEASEFGRGDRVRVKSGKDQGAEGTIFWWGESKWGKGMRAGVETGEGEKLWIDAEHLESLDADDAEPDDDLPF